MKKAFIVLASICLIFALSVPAFADHVWSDEEYATAMQVLINVTNSVDSLVQRVSDLELALESGVYDDSDLQQAISDLQVDVGDLSTAVSSLSEGSEVDLSGIESSLSFIQTRLVALEARASSSPSEAAFDLDSVSSYNEGSVPAILVSLFGEYNPRTESYTVSEDGTDVTYTRIVSGVAGMDWPWICSAALFALLLFCLMRMIGGIFKWK